MTEVAAATGVSLATLRRTLKSRTLSLQRLRPRLMSPDAVPVAPAHMPSGSGSDRMLDSAATNQNPSIDEVSVTSRTTPTTGRVS